jgi:hypothetical protein
LKLYLRDGQRASCDKPHAQVARDLGRKLHVFSTQEPRLADGYKKYLQTGVAIPFRMDTIRVVPSQTVTSIGQQSEQIKELPPQIFD